MYSGVIKTAAEENEHYQANRLEIAIMIIIGALTFLVLLAGCSAPLIRTDMLVPGRFTEPAQLKSVAVLPFDGPDGMEYSSLIEAKLASIVINDQQCSRISGDGFTLQR